VKFSVIAGLKEIVKIYDHILIYKRNGTQKGKFRRGALNSNNQ